MEVGSEIYFGSHRTRTDLQGGPKQHISLAHKNGTAHSPIASALLRLRRKGEEKGAN